MRRTAGLCVASMLAMWLVAAIAAHAHILPGSYLRLSVDGSTLSGTWDLSLLSLAETAEVTDKSYAELQEFALEKLSITADDGPCTLAIDETGPAGEADGDQTIQPMRIAGQCERTITRLTISFFSLFVIDTKFEGLVHVRARGQVHTSALSVENPYVIFELGAPNRWQQFIDYLREGVRHIWLGFDHILFLLSLLLPAAFVIAGGKWQPRDDRLAGTFWQVTKIVTAFTLAHSITLGLSVFDTISLPPRLVESAIALSIVIAAANNAYPKVSRHLWLLTFCFGLVHGMGFAGALRELGLPDDTLWIALGGFNIGVELGQLAIVAAVLPVLYALRHVMWYRTVILRAASFAIIAVALAWFAERAFAITIFDAILGG